MSRVFQTGEAARAKTLIKVNISQLVLERESQRD